MPHQKTFPCGHKGLGQYCHRCHNKTQEIEAKKQKREERLSKQKSLPVNVKGLPEHIVKKGLKKIAKIEGGAVHTAIGGKKLSNRSDIVTVPLGPTYRLILSKDGKAIEPEAILSHQKYNRVIRKLR